MSAREAHRLFALLLGLAGGLTAQQLPPVPVPPENPITPQKAVLGKILFWEEQLSSDDSVACGTCHISAVGGVDPRIASNIDPGPDGLFNTADDKHGAAGIVGQDPLGDYKLVAPFGHRVQVTPRASATVIGAAYNQLLFWIGAATNQFVDPETNMVAVAAGGALESQAVFPPFQTQEMGAEGRTWQDVRTKLQQVTPLRLATNLPPDVQAALAANPTYPALFTAAFGDPAINSQRVAFALATYERTLIPDQTPFDAWVNGNQNALTPNQQQGLQLFNGAARCSLCHPAPLFTDDLFHNVGLRPVNDDPGRQIVTQLASDGAAFKTPTLRNAALRPLLFHDGSSPQIGTPQQVTDPLSTLNVFFHGGGPVRGNLSPLLIDLANNGVTMGDMQKVYDFLQNGLTDARVTNSQPPFDHPTLRSTTQPQPTRLGASLAGAHQPALITTAPGWLGNQGFKLGFAGGVGNAVAYVAYSMQAPAQPVYFGQLPVNIGPAIVGHVQILAGTTPDPGIGTWRLAIPAQPNLMNFTFFMQVFVLDAAAPGGIATSQAADIVVR